MATITFQVCDECGQMPRLSVELDGYVFCSRECYLAHCKRAFDRRWMEMILSRRKSKKTQGTDLIEFRKSA